LNKTNVIQMPNCCGKLVSSNTFGQNNAFSQFFSLKFERLMPDQKPSILSLLWEQYTVLLSTLPSTYHCKYILLNKII